MREEADVEEDIDERFGRLDLPAIDVDDVGERVESEERDCDRERHLDEADRGIDSERRQGVDQLGREEVPIFEIAEQAEISGHRNPQHRAAQDPVGEPSKKKRRKVVSKRACKQERDEFHLPIGIEIIARCHQEPLFPGVVTVQQPRDRENDREKHREIDGRKQHLCTLGLRGRDAPRRWRCRFVQDQRAQTSFEERLKDASPHDEVFVCGDGNRQLDRGRARPDVSSPCGLRGWGTVRNGRRCGSRRRRFWDRYGPRRDPRPRW